MKLLQFALPERVGAICAEATATICGGATLIPNALGWWVNGRGEVERERIHWLIVGVGENEVEEVVKVIKEILRREGEKAVFYTIGTEPRLEWL
jgi:hypothetical protein